MTAALRLERQGCGLSQLNCSLGASKDPKEFTHKANGDLTYLVSGVLHLTETLQEKTGKLCEK